VSASRAMTQQQDIFRLAVKFSGVQYSLMQDLLQQHAGYQPDDMRSVSMKALNLSDVPVELLLQQLQQQQQGQQAQPLSPRRTQQYSKKPVQAMLADCLEEPVTKYIGRSSGEGTSTIHDASPYTIALRMRDAAFFRLPAVLAHTQRLWQGTELEKMQALAHSGSAGSDDLLPGARQKSARNTKRHLGRGRVKLMSAAAFQGAGGAADDSSSSSGGAAGFGTMARGAAAGGWLGSVQEAPDDNTPQTASATQAAAGPAALSGSTGRDDHVAQSLYSRAAGSTAAFLQAGGDGTCCLSVSAPGYVDEDEEAAPESSVAAVPQRRMPQAAAAGRLGPGPCAEGVEFDSTGSCNSTAASSRHSLTTAGYSSSCSTAASAMASFSMKRQQHDDPWLNPSVGLELMQNMGLAGSGSQPFAWASSVLLHAALLAPRALYNSPRGRWVMRCLFEAMFLTLYQVRHGVGYCSTCMVAVFTCHRMTYFAVVLSLHTEHAISRMQPTCLKPKHKLSASTDGCSCSITLQGPGGYVRRLNIFVGCGLLSASHAACCSAAVCLLRTWDVELTAVVHACRLL
jgi:hypothetical protein